jgi:hypothetical protein
MRAPRVLVPGVSESEARLVCMSVSPSRRAHRRFARSGHFRLAETGHVARSGQRLVALAGKPGELNP